MPHVQPATRAKHCWASQPWHPRKSLPSLLALFVAGVLSASSGLALAEEPDGPLTGAASSEAAGSADRAKLRTPLTPPWALKCWLWEDDDSTAAAITELPDHVDSTTGDTRFEVFASQLVGKSETNAR